MAIKHLSKFNGLRVIVTDSGEKEVEYLLDDSGSKSLTCDQCDSKKFIVEVLIKSEMTISSGINTLICENDNKDILVVRVKECAICGSDYFILEDTDKNKDDLRAIMKAADNMYKTADNVGE